jgi:hypothetical protein
MPESKAEPVPREGELLSRCHSGRIAARRFDNLVGSFVDAGIKCNDYSSLPTGAPGTVIASHGYSLGQFLEVDMKKTILIVLLLMAVTSLAFPQSGYSHGHWYVPGAFIGGALLGAALVRPYAAYPPPPAYTYPAPVYAYPAPVYGYPYYGPRYYPPRYHGYYGGRGYYGRRW